MKRYAPIILIALLAALLAGCGALPPQGDDLTPPPLVAEDATPATKSSPTPTDTPQPTDAPTDTPTHTPSPTPSPTPTAMPTLSPAEIAYRNLTPTPDQTLFETCMLNANCTPPPAPPVEALQDTENILLLGTDRREGWDTWRTDTVMLVIINRKINQIAVVSFPRDLFLYHPAFGKRKLNVFDYLGEDAGYNADDFRAIKEVFEYNFGVPIAHVVRVHRSAFVEFVDAIGGIDISLDCDLWEISPKDSGGYDVLYLPAGPHHLNGETALKFATYRYRTADWGRARRQQETLAAIKHQALQLGLVTKAADIWSIIRRNVVTDLGFMDLVRYVQYGVNLDVRSIHSHVLSNRELQSARLSQNGAYVLFPKEAGAIRDILENIFEYVPISVQGTHPQGCPPTPEWAPEYLASLTPTPPPQ